MNIRSLKTAALSLLCVGSLTLTGLADPIVDTGTPDNSVGWWFSQYQYFGGQFSISSATTINSVEGFFGNENGTAGNVAIQIHSDLGNAPDALLYSDLLAMTANDPLGWHGLSGLGWNLAAGTYWVSFRPDANIDGSMPDAAPSPLATYIQANSGTFIPGNWSHLHVGIRIDGDAASVPDQGSVAVMFGLASLAGAALVRRQRRV